MRPDVIRIMICGTILALTSVASAATINADAGADGGDAFTAIGRHIWPQLLLGVYCGLIVLGSLVGGWLPTKVRLTHTRMQLVISFVGGLMLGIGMLHLLPHAAVELDGFDDAAASALAGILVMFLLIRAFHVHHHGAFELPDSTAMVVADSYQHHLESADTHDHDCGHDHSHSGGRFQPHKLSWFGIALGLGLHSLIDGMALGASVEGDQGRGTIGSLFGVGTFLAIVLHKPLDAVSITSLMGAAGWSARWQNAVNIAFALMVPAGAAMFLFGVRHFGEGQHQLVGIALGFSAGVFVCISLGDLLPEMEFHKHSRVPLTCALLLGIALAWAITFLEPAHQHALPPSSRTTSAQWNPQLPATTIETASHLE